MLGSMNDYGAKSMPMSTMPWAMPTATHSMRMGGSKTSPTISASASPTYNATSGAVRGGIISVLGAVVAATSLLL